MPSSLLGKSVPIDGGGGVCAVSRSRARPQDTRRQRHRKFMTSPSNPTKFVLKVRQFVGWFVELHLLSPLSQWTKRGEILGGYSDCPTSKLQIQILVRVECCGVCSAAHAAFRFPAFELSGRPTNGRSTPRLSQRQPASGWYRCVGWRQRYLRRRASSLIMVADVENFAPKNFLVREEKS